jgi:hypothetical protein
MTFLVTYFSALDCAIRRKGYDMTPIAETLCADSSWSAEQVSEAFLRHHPGIELVACTAQP